MRFRSSVVATFSLLLLATFTQAQTPVTCHIQKLQPPSGTSVALTSGMGINRYGTIVGWSSNAKGFVRYNDGTVKSLGVNISGYPNVYPMRRNATGVTVGFLSSTTGGGDRAFIRSGSTTKLFTAPGYSTIAGLMGVNRYGTLVGNLRNTTGESVGNGFVYKNGQLTKLPINVAHRVWSISDTGVIIGSYVNNTNPQPFDDIHGFVFANGKFQDFSAPWASTTFPTDINASGMIVGVTEGPGGSFIYRNGKFYKPTFVLSSGSAINGLIFGVNGYGQITGQAGSGANPAAFVGSCAF